MISTDAQNAADRFRIPRQLCAKGDATGILELEKIASEGSVDAMVFLGEAYWNGPFNDPIKAEYWFRSAYQYRKVEGTILFLGRFLYQQNRGEEAAAMFAEGATKGYGLCMYWLAVTYIHDNAKRNSHADQIKMLLETASRQGYVVATQLLWRRLIRGTYGLHNIPLGVFMYFRMLRQVISIGSKNIYDPRLLIE